ncbi:MAG: acetylxylan esterase [Clostridia bacterium]|nr:acetylxylan esterase [Clostridia bacterium]
MPIIDMPLGELRKYAGLNPRPVDFDAYWDDSLAEMRDTDPRVELRPAEFSAPGTECFHLFFTGVHGARVHAKYMRPAGKTGCPAILFFHGYSGCSGDWYGKLPFALSGFCVAALDCRGQGGISEDVGGVRGNTLHGQIIRGLDDPDSRKLLMRDIFLDSAQLAGIVMDFPEVDSERTGACGGSQGGGLTLACAALEPRLNRAAPCYPFLCDYQRVWEMDLAKDAYAELREYFRLFDPIHEREQYIFTKLGYIDNQYLAPRICARVMMGVGLMDTICPPSTQFAAYNKITSPKEMVIYPDYGHENLADWDDKVYRFMLEM